MSREIFLTSSPFDEPDRVLNPANQFIEKLTCSLQGAKKALFIASAPDEVKETEEFAREVRETLERSHIVFEEYRILDSRNDKDAEALVGDSEFIILAGGHVPTQNKFFEKTGLRRLMETYEGVVMGISAGTMNSADIVYAQPELEGESVDASYQKFLTGLNLTKCMILPHYQYTKNLMLDGKRLFEDITYGDSNGQVFYALPDGSYLYAKDGGEKICGEAYLIKDGTCTQICRKGDERTAGWSADKGGDN